MHFYRLVAVSRAKHLLATLRLVSPFACPAFITVAPTVLTLVEFHIVVRGGGGGGGCKTFSSNSRFR